LTAATATRWHACIRAFRGVDTAAPFLDELAGRQNSLTATHNLLSVSSTDADAWAVVTLVAREVASPFTATPGAGLVQRVDQDNGVAGTSNTLYFAADSNGPVTVGPHGYRVTTSSATSHAVGWAGILKPAAGAPVIAGVTAVVSAVTAAGSVVGGVGGPVEVVGKTATVVVQGGVRPVPPAPGGLGDAWPPDPYREVIRSGGYGLLFKAKASLGGVPIAGAQDLRPTGGTIVDTTKPGVRRVLNVQFAPAPGLFDRLSPIGTVLTVTALVTYPNRDVQEIPMGVFDVDSQTLSEGGGGPVSLVAPDKWVRIQRARFLAPTNSRKGMLVVDQIALLIRGALGSAEQVVVSATSMAKVGVLTWEKDRDKAILDLAESIGAWVFFDRLGVATIADLPNIGASANWLIDASASGVLIELDRERSRTETRNVVVVESSAAAGASFPTQYVWDADPTSPTYAGTNPKTNPESAGPFGIVPFYYDTPLPLDVAGARVAGATILARVKGLASQVSLGSAPNPAMEASHVIDVLPLRERYDIARVLERHLVDTVTHPLSLGSAQHIEGRSTRAEQIAGGS
jgi:hypothetical protein